MTKHYSQWVVGFVKLKLNFIIIFDRKDKTHIINIIHLGFYRLQHYLFYTSRLRMSLNRSNLKAEEDGSRVDKEQMQGQVQCSIVRPNLSRHTKHAIVPGPGGSWARYLLVLGGELGVWL